MGQLGFYAKRLRKEETTRRLGLIFVVLALVIQSLAVFQPPEPANASNASDMVYGGIGQSIDNFLSPYDSNSRHLRDIMNYVGITRSEILATKFTSWKVGDKLSWGLAPHFSYDQGERQYTITGPDGQQETTAYSRPLKLWTDQNSQIQGWVGYSNKIGWFAIMPACGNLVTDTTPPPPPPPKCIVNSSLLASDSNCQPCPGNTTIWISDPSCSPNVVKSKTATNLSQNFMDASLITARASDQISYSISVENIGLKSVNTKLEENIADILEYATLNDDGGGTFDNTTNILSWPDVILAPKTKQTRTFVVRLKNPIPITSLGTSNELSYDCIMSNTFGSITNIKVDCSSTKVVERITAQLPKTGPTENLIFAGIVLSITIYFYARARQVKKEIYLIRRDTNSGTI